MYGRKIIAVTAPQESCTEEGTWHRVYTVRRLDDATMQQYRDEGLLHPLETRRWIVEYERIGVGAHVPTLWQLGDTRDEAIRAGWSDTAYRNAESRDPSHAVMTLRLAQLDVLAEDVRRCEQLLAGCVAAAARDYREASTAAYATAVARGGDTETTRARFLARRGPEMERLTANVKDATERLARARRDYKNACEKRG